MARLWLIAVLLLLSASAGSSLENPVKVDQNKNPASFQRPTNTQITEIVNDLWNRLRAGSLPMFSLAVSIPYNNNKKEYDVSKVTFDPNEVKATILGCDVYSSKRMVAATVLKWPDVLDQCPNAQVPWTDVLKKCKTTSMTWAQVKDQCPGAFQNPTRADHAEYRVLQNFNILKNNLNNLKQDFLLFYVLASPCDQKCTSTTSPFSILDSIKVIKKWENYAVVFSKVFKPRGGEPVPVDDLKGALERLGKHDVHPGPIGLENILRCDGMGPCRNCSSVNDVTPFCYSDGPQPAPSNNAASTSVNNINDGRNAAIKKGKNG